MSNKDLTLTKEQLYAFLDHRNIYNEFKEWDYSYVQPRSGLNKREFTEQQWIDYRSERYMQELRKLYPSRTIFNMLRKAKVSLDLTNEQAADVIGIHRKLLPPSHWDAYRKSQNDRSTRSRPASP